MIVYVIIKYFYYIKNFHLSLILIYYNYQAEVSVNLELPAFHHVEVFTLKGWTWRDSNSRLNNRQ